jgi:hypothetical protein
VSSFEEGKAVLLGYEIRAADRITRGLGILPCDTSLGQWRPGRLFNLIFGYIILPGGGTRIRRGGKHFFGCEVGP